MFPDGRTIACGGTRPTSRVEMAICEINGCKLFQIKMRHLQQLTVEFMSQVVQASSTAVAIYSHLAARNCYKSCRSDCDYAAWQQLHMLQSPHPVLSAGDIKNHNTKKSPQTEYIRITRRIWSLPVQTALCNHSGEYIAKRSSKIVQAILSRRLTGECAVRSGQPCIANATCLK